MENKRAFLGTGWGFPPEFVKGNNEVIMTSEEEDIKKSLHILLTTKLGERVMLPEYGCNLEELLFEKDDLSKMNVLRRIISPMGTMDGIEFLISKIKDTKNNSDFFNSMNKSN